MTINTDKIATLWLRPGELIVKVTADHTAGIICPKHGSLTSANFAWDRCITSGHAHPVGVTEATDPTGTFTNAEDWFNCLRPSNGAEPCTPSGCFPMSRCAACGAYQSFTTKQEAYGDRTTCRVCGDEHYYSIGD